MTTLTCRDQEVAAACEAHARNMHGHVLGCLDWLWLSLLDACRQGRWADARYYAFELGAAHRPGSAVHREADCIRIRLAGK